MITRWIVWAEVNLVSCHARDQRFLCCARFCRPTGGQGVDAALSDFEDATEQVDTDHKRTASTPCAQHFARHGSTVACSCRPCLQVERQGAKPPALTRARGHPPRLQATSTDAGAPCSRPRAAQHPCRPLLIALCVRRCHRGRRLRRRPRHRFLFRFCLLVTTLGAAIAVTSTVVVTSIAAPPLPPSPAPLCPTRPGAAGRRAPLTELAVAAPQRGTCAPGC